MVLFILWIALFGVFGGVCILSCLPEESYETDITGKQMYIKENAEGNSDIQRMKNAVWVVLANALLWLITSVAGFVYWWTHKERTSRFTGRAKV